jgi:putative Holliday junction resolvase
MPDMPDSVQISSLATPQTFLAFDFGKKRIGVAVGNSLTKQAQALSIIGFASINERFARIQSLIQEWQPQALVVGLPRHPDGASHEMTEAATRFGHQLQGRFHLPVYWVDERYTSVAVEHGHDALAAALILEQYFSEQNV